MWLGSLCRRRGLDGRGRQHWRAEQLPRQVRDALEVEGVEDLEGEDDLVELDLPVGALEHPGASGDGEVGLLVGEVTGGPSWGPRWAVAPPAKMQFYYYPLVISLQPISPCRITSYDLLHWEENTERSQRTGARRRKLT